MRQKKQSADGEKKTILPGLDDAAGTRWLTERKCPECGKSFCVVDMEAYVYKNRGQAFCSWHCMRAREARKNEWATKRQSKAGNIRLSAEQRQQVERMIKQGKSDAEICQTFGVGKEVVWYHKQKIRKKAENE